MSRFLVSVHIVTQVRMPTDNTVNTDVPASHLCNRTTSRLITYTKEKIGLLHIFGTAEPHDWAEGDADDD